MTPRLILLAGLLLLGASSSGCRRMARVSECRELITAVNGHMDELEPLSKAKDSPEKYTKLGQSYQKLADDVAALPVAKGAASAPVMEYVEQMRSAAKSSREAAEALKAGGRNDAQRKELDKLSRKDKVIAQRLDAYCQAP
jgi:hypothetical protein